MFGGAHVSVKNLSARIRVKLCFAGAHVSLNQQTCLAALGPCWLVETNLLARIGVKLLLGGAHGSLKIHILQSGLG